MQVKELVREVKKIRREKAAKRIVNLMDRHDVYIQDIVDYCVAELKKRKPEKYTPITPEINPGYSD